LSQHNISYYRTLEVYVTWRWERFVLSCYSSGVCGIGYASSAADLSQRSILIPFAFRSSKKLIMPHRPQARIAKQKLQLPIMRLRVLYKVRWKHRVLF